MVEISKTPNVVYGGQKKQKFIPFGSSDIYYEQKLKEVFYMAADNPEGILYSEEVWNYFIALLLKSRLATVRDVERIETVKPSFPLTFETFVNTIQQEFGDHSLKQLNTNLDDTKEQLENCRTLINMMNIRFLQRTELKQLATLIYQSNRKGIES